MKNLETLCKDRHSKEAFEALSDSLASGARSPLLSKLKDGALSLKEFGFVTKVRLDAAGNFIPFLSATEKKIKVHGEWHDMALALRENLDEELGITQGIYDANADHDVWRTRYRGGIERVLGTEGISFADIDANDIIRDIGVFYGDQLKKMPNQRTAPVLAGAFTMLEGLLEKEFSATLAFIRLRLRELTEKERYYVEHHAGHEHKHLSEAAIPLLKKCTSSPDIVPEVIAGMQEMEKLRTQEVLQRIDTNIWKA